ncbi:50S ribosomal protein L2 [Pedobacter cryophilus]|jgi:large subunit ribosomal protein L2|uniref:Large ribosomal subunit protein uL2 n=1 Tax=Pedobacter cryophilus TaxID=2571271 RepID=A0A4U1BZ08_9SPHI|nr:50S ribosomal protein L2 [Pedobacter cryophilus]TKB96726.1 50S ribosomal protein L2 [Pedobacter cryophilus]
MGLRKFKPVTPGTRFRVGADFSEITTRTPEKTLVVKSNKSGGRNNTGKMTMRYIGGGHKQLYRLIDFKRDKKDIPATVATIEYDPNRTARIALLHYADGEKRYIIAPEGLQVGKVVISGDTVAPEVGNTIKLANIPLGSIIHNIEINPGRGAQIARSAGSYAQLAARDGKYATVKMPSGETRMILVTCTATIGTVSNSEHANEVLGKAGRKRWLGRRPRVRGVAMNPVDHPMGGGEGRSSGGHPRSRKGLLSKGFKTRDKKKYSNRFIIERRKK